MRQRIKVEYDDSHTVHNPYVATVQKRVLGLMWVTTLKHLSVGASPEEAIERLRSKLPQYEEV